MALDATLVSTPPLELPPSPDDLIEKLRELASPTYPAQDPSTLTIQATALIGRLKSLNRAANSATRLHKDATADARHEIDQAHLQLQNLLYEKRHLEREIEKCRQFATVYQDVPLYTLEEYKRLAPEEMRTEQILGDEHQLMLNRLNFELTERQRLDQRRKELAREKEELLQLSKTKVTTMDSVKAHLDLLMKTASDVQKKVDDLVTPSSKISTSEPALP